MMNGGRFSATRAGGPGGVLAGIAAFLVYLRTMCPGIASDDVPEMILAAWRMDVTHPPGYPLFILLGKLISFLPVGNLAFRISLLSAGAGAASIGLLFGLLQAIWRMAGRRSSGPAGWLWSAAAALALTTAHTWWWQSGQADKYALSFLLACLCLRIALLDYPLPLLAFSLGLTLSHHPLAIFMLPLLLLRRAGLAKARNALLAGLLLVLPLSLKALYPAMRAPASPPVNWRNPATAGKLFSYLTVRGYADRMKPPLSAALAKVPEHASFYLRQFGPLVGAISLAGLIRLAAARPPLALPLALWFAGTFIFALNFRLDSFLVETYHAQNFLLLGLGLGAGFAPFSSLIPSPRLDRAGRWLLLAALCGTLIRLPHLAGIYDRSRDMLLYDFNRNTLRLAPPGSYLFAGSDYDLFSLLFLTGPAAIRTDVTVLDMPQHPKNENYWPRALAALSPGNFDPRPETDPAGVINALVQAVPPAKCIAFTAFSCHSLAVPLVTRGPLLIPVRARCAPRERGIAPWHALTLRGAFSPLAGQPWNRAVLAAYGIALDFSADSLAAEANFPEALRVSAWHTRLRPGEASAWIGRAAVLDRAGRPLEALSSYQAAMRLSPAELEPHVGVLEIIRSRRAFRLLPQASHDARAALEYGLRRDAERAAEKHEAGSSGEALELLARTLAREAERRAEEIESGTAVRPNDPRRLKAALGFSLLAIQADPEWDIPYARASRILLRFYNFEGALRLSRTWRRISPDSPRAAFAEGLSLLALGELAAAGAALEKALNLDPGLSEAREMLARARELAGAAPAP